MLDGLGRADPEARYRSDETRALEPLVPEPLWQAGEAPETCPSGLRPAPWPTAPQGRS